MTRHDRPDATVDEGSQAPARGSADRCGWSRARVVATSRFGSRRLPSVGPRCAYDDGYYRPSADDVYSRTSVDKFHAAAVVRGFVSSEQLRDRRGGRDPRWGARTAHRGAAISRPARERRRGLAGLLCPVGRHGDTALREPLRRFRWLRSHQPARFAHRCRRHRADLTAARPRRSRAPHVPREHRRALLRSGPGSRAQRWVWQHHLQRTCEMDPARDRSACIAHRCAMRSSAGSARKSIRSLMPQRRRTLHHIREPILDRDGGCGEECRPALMQ
jgi:hypothetical protein